MSNNIKNIDLELGKILWDYNNIETPLSRADIIFILGSNEIRVADHAAELFKKGLAPTIIVSGGLAHQNDLLNTGWDKSEAEIFFDRLVELNIPKNKILIEKEAQNTGQNIINSRKILFDNNIDINSGIIVQKPFMKRRAIATACKQWSEVKWYVSSPNISYEEFLSTFGESNVLNILVGDTWRIIDYYEKGFQTKQDMPSFVKSALFEMINLGYDKHIPQNK